MSLISITSKYCITTGHWPTQIWKISFRRLNLAIYLHIISSKWLSVDCRSSAISHYYLWPRSKKLFDRTFYENRQSHLASATILNTFLELRRPLETSLSKQTIAMQIPKGSDDITSHSLTCQDWLQKPQPAQFSSMCKNWIDSHNVFVDIATRAWSSAAVIDL